jgi:hypothetical protein
MLNIHIRLQHGALYIPDYLVHDLFIDPSRPYKFLKGILK